MSPEVKRVVVGAAIVFGTLGYLVTAGIGENLVYFVTPSELIAREDPAFGQPVRLSGAVAAGSVEWDPAALSLTFRIEDDERSIPIQSEGAPPHMFQDGIQVIVEGRLEPSGVFLANNLMVKHSNEYGPDGNASVGEGPVGLDES